MCCLGSSMSDQFIGVLQTGDYNQMDEWIKLHCDSSVISLFEEIPDKTLLQTCIENKNYTAASYLLHHPLLYNLNEWKENPAFISKILNKKYYQTDQEKRYMKSICKLILNHPHFNSALHQVTIEIFKIPTKSVTAHDLALLLSSGAKWTYESLMKHLKQSIHNDHEYSTVITGDFMHKTKLYKDNWEKHMFSQNITLIEKKHIFFKMLGKDPPNLYDFLLNATMYLYQPTLKSDYFELEKIYQTFRQLGTKYVEILIDSECPLKNEFASIHYKKTKAEENRMRSRSDYFEGYGAIAYEEISRSKIINYIQSGSGNNIAAIQKFKSLILSKIESEINYHSGQSFVGYSSGGTGHQEQWDHSQDFKIGILKSLKQDIINACK